MHINVTFLLIPRINNTNYFDFHCKLENIPTIKIEQ